MPISLTAREGPEHGLSPYPTVKRWPGEILDAHLRVISEQTRNFREGRIDPDSIPPTPPKGPAYRQRIIFTTNETSASEFNLPHAMAFLTRRAALRHNASKYNPNFFGISARRETVFFNFLFIC